MWHKSWMKRPSNLKLFPQRTLEKTRKQYGFWVRYPWREIETEVKPTCRSGGTAVAKAHTNSPSGRLSYMRMTWTVSRSSNDLSPSLLLSLYVLLFVSSLKSSVNFSVSGFPAPWECCWSENGLSEWSLSCCAHGSHCTWDGPENGLFEISKLHDYWSLPGACWLEMLFDLLWSPYKRDGIWLKVWSHLSYCTLSPKFSHAFFRFFVFSIPFLSKCLQEAEKKIEPDPNFLGRTKVSEAVCKCDWHNVSRIYFLRAKFRTKKFTLCAETLMFIRWNFIVCYTNSLMTNRKLHSLKVTSVRSALHSLLHYWQ